TARPKPAKTNAFIPNRQPATDILARMKSAQLNRLYSVAKMYYEDHLNQNEIARRLGVSRTSISRMLTDAQKHGILTITVNPPLLQETEIAEEIKASFGIDHVTVVPSMDSEHDTLKAVGHVAAAKLVETLQPGMSLSMTWGRVIAEIVNEMPDNNLENIHVTTMVGAIGGMQPELDGPDLARRMAKALHGTYEYINAPAVVITGGVRDQLISTVQIHDVLDKAAASDAMVYGVGTLDDPHSSLNQAGYISEQEQHLYQAQGGVGHLNARIIDADGNEVEEFNKRVVSIPLAALASASCSMCVAAGVSKAPTLRAILRRRLTNYLIVDSRCAAAVLADTSSRKR
ncbi:DeoR transcriptional regulator, partial [Bifidobacterium margollesii]